jgi:hypothetical protein
MAQYRWAHVMVGKGRNVISGGVRPTDPIPPDTTSLQSTTHRIYGGIYYGLQYAQLINQIWPSMYGTTNDTDNDTGTTFPTPAVMTIPMTGPGRGKTQWSIVRVSESPKEWQERLLLNSAVIGWVEPDSMSVVQQMAVQRQGPPTIVDSGIL